MVLQTTQHNIAIDDGDVHVDHKGNRKESEVAVIRSSFGPDANFTEIIIEEIRELRGEVRSLRRDFIELPNVETCKNSVGNANFGTKERKKSKNNNRHKKKSKNRRRSRENLSSPLVRFFGGRKFAWIAAAVAISFAGLLTNVTSGQGRGDGNEAGRKLVSRLRERDRIVEENDKWAMFGSEIDGGQRKTSNGFAEQQIWDSEGRQNAGTLQSDNMFSDFKMFYPDFINEHCTDDPTSDMLYSRPYETVEECCEAWFGIGEDIAETCLTRFQSKSSTSPSFRPSSSPISYSSHSPHVTDSTYFPTSASSPTSPFSTKATYWPTYAYFFATNIPTTIEDVCPDANPNHCGCLSTNQREYRGKINVTQAGKECMNWAEYLGDDPENGLEKNYCRNPWNKNLAWCFYEYTDGAFLWDYCSVPTCGAECVNSNPDSCGCRSRYQTDYRGTINVTRTGLPCKPWSDYEAESYPHAKLAGNNYCRNIDEKERAWCHLEDGYTGPTDNRWDYCDVPYCESVSCDLPDYESCGCENANQADYQGNITSSVGGEGCMFWGDVWETEWNAPVGIVRSIESDYAKWDHNFCRSIEIEEGAGCYTPDSTENGRDWRKWESCDVPKCNPCSCPATCNDFNYTESCGCPHVLQANQCCEATDSDCRCTYLKLACFSSLQNEVTDYCSEASTECNVPDDGGVFGNCTMMQTLCLEYKDLWTCQLASEYCCSSVSSDSYNKCRCTYLSHVETKGSPVLYYLFNNACSLFPSSEDLNASQTEFALEQIFNTIGGQHWHNNSGWLTPEVDKCDWFGVTCDDNDGAVIGIDLNGNNLVGAFPSKAISMLFDLERLNLANNSLFGTIDYNAFYLNEDLLYVDISGNNLSGVADIFFSPAVKRVNLSHNDFDYANFFKPFHPALKTLAQVDLSSNDIKHDGEQLFNHWAAYIYEYEVLFPPNLVELVLSDNDISGTLPEHLPRLEQLTYFSIANNNMTGPLSDFSKYFPELRTLDLSNQVAKGRGFTGTIPASLSKIQFLNELNLAGNRLTQTVPAEISDLSQLANLNLSSNELSGTILPVDWTAIEVLDVSTNKLSGTIPVNLAGLTHSIIHLGRNRDLFQPAPLSLCTVVGFDLGTDPYFCPLERNILAEFYYLAKGGEWTESISWVDEYESHCQWMNVTCDERNNVVMIELSNNGLSGKLSTSIGNLSSLEVLDLSDNDIKGSIPSDIGRLLNLNRLRLSFNGFTGTAPQDLENLTRLKLVQIHGNRISGTIPNIRVDKADLKESSFVSDCGVPTEFDDPLACISCTMCCNSLGDCNPNYRTSIQSGGFSGYTQFSWVFFVAIFGFSLLIIIASFFYDKFKIRKSSNLTNYGSRRQSMKRKAKKYALDKIGENSVYRFFLGKSWWGWSVALVVMATQIWILFTFVRGAEFDLSDDNSDFVYTWMCPRDRIECDNKADLTTAGWVMFGVIMTSHLLKDIVNGSKMLVLCAKEGHPMNWRVRYFFGGLFLVTVTTFTLFASTIYNKAIATSNTEIISNAVIILFITDLDEQFFSLLEVIDGRLVTWLSGIEDVVVEKVDDPNSYVPSSFQPEPQSPSLSLNLENGFGEVKERIDRRLDAFWEEAMAILTDKKLRGECKGDDCENL